jgi:NAD(P)-dependent dehydrogenase (short-subunit alcohol dehydrogenase family)
MRTWNTSLLPDQTGKAVIITGASSGLGLCCAETLAERGASVILAVRDTAKGATVADAIRARHAHAQLTVSHLDLASLASVATFARQINDTAPRIDVLLNNAGLGLQPTRGTTQDGFERQFGTNHLGHFALTAQLIPALLRAPAPRVVTVASIAHRRGQILWDDPNLTTAYDGRTAYNQSKLANLMFALDLASRATAQGSRVASIAAHPGLSLTGFIAATGMPLYKQWVGIVASRLIGQSAQAGSWPLLYAAAMPDARNGEYWGPDGVLEIRGLPARGKVWPQALMAADQARLWALSEALTGVTFPSLT